jgi:hypothetical protein
MITITVLGTIGHEAYAQLLSQMQAMEKTSGPVAIAITNKHGIPTLEWMDIAPHQPTLFDQ